jgi:hypothetical protein
MKFLTHWKHVVSSLWTPSCNCCLRKYSLFDYHTKHTKHTVYKMQSFLVLKKVVLILCSKVQSTDRLWSTFDDQSCFISTATVLIYYLICYIWRSLCHFDVRYLYSDVWSTYRGHCVSFSCTVSSIYDQTLYRM